MNIYSSGKKYIWNENYAWQFNSRLAKDQWTWRDKRHYPKHSPENANWHSLSEWPVNSNTLHNTHETGVSQAEGKGQQQPAEELMAGQPADVTIQGTENKINLKKTVAEHIIIKLLKPG